MSAAPNMRTDSQPCECCSAPCNFNVIDSPKTNVPSFLSPLWPEGCWLGWAWSTETTGKLELVVFCSQTCLVEWFEHETAPEGA
jgi:hypothetical protein